jgi:hypothetical protein
LGADPIVIRIFHTVVYAFAGLFTYLAGKEIFGSKIWAATGAILLVGWPSLAFYTNVFTPEHLFILVESALIFVLAAFFNNQHKHESKAGEWRQSLIWFASMGLLMGICGLFRPFGELFLAAFVLTVLLSIRKRKLSEITINLLCLLLPFWLVTKMPTAVIKYYQGEPPKNVRPCNLLVGMNFEAAGQYNSPDRELCTRLRDEAADEAAFTSRVIGVVWERFQSQKDGLLLFVDRKFAILWANSNGILFWALGQVPGENQNFIFDLARKVNVVDFAIMFIITITCLIGALMVFFKGVKPVILFCLLSFFGFNLMEIPLELQTRYRTVVMPLMILFACWTLAAISGSLNSSQAFDKAELSSDLTGG